MTLRRRQSAYVVAFNKATRRYDAQMRASFRGPEWQICSGHRSAPVAVAKAAWLNNKIATLNRAAS